MIEEEEEEEEEEEKEGTHWSLLVLICVVYFACMNYH